MIFKLQDIPV